MRTLIPFQTRTALIPTALIPTAPIPTTLFLTALILTALTSAIIMPSPAAAQSPEHATPAQPDLNAHSDHSTHSDQNAQPTTDDRLDENGVSELNDFEDALALATRERKYLIVVLYENDCKECDRVENEIFNNPEYLDWAKTRANILRLHREDPIGRNFSIAHRIESAPTAVILANDGRELGREIRFHNVKRFLLRIGIAIQGPNISKKGEARWAGHDVILATMDRAKSLTAEGKYEDAFKEYLWCLEHRASRSPMFSATYLKDLIHGVGELGQHHPPAREDLQTRFDDARKITVQEQATDVYALYVLRHAAEALNKSEDLVKHYDRIKQYWPDSPKVSLFARLIFEPLLNARRYNDIAFAVEQPGDVDVYLEESRSIQRDPSEMSRALGSRYEVLLGLGRSDEAKDLANKWLSYGESPEAYKALANASLRSGKAIRDNLLYAKKAYALSKSKDTETTIMLARMLSKADPKSKEAAQVLETALRTASNPEDAKQLGAAMREIQQRQRKSSKRN